VFQPISLLSYYDGSGQTFGSRLIMDGWQWSRFWCWVTPRSLPFPASVPELWFSESGGGYRRYSHLCSNCK